jgi:CRP-like cAMP-binding protein
MGYKTWIAKKERSLKKLCTIPITYEWSGDMAYSKFRSFTIPSKYEGKMGSIDRNKWESYCKYGTRLFFKKNTTVYQEDTYGNGFYFIDSGFVKMFTSTLKGNDRLLNVAFSGDILGIQALDENPYSTTAITAKDTVLYFFNRDQILELIRNQPESMELITNTLIRNTNLILQGIYLDTMTPKHRVSYVLETYYHEFQKNKAFLTIQDIASYTGLTRVTVYKILKELEVEEIINIKNGKLVIKQPDLL